MHMHMRAGTVGPDRICYGNQIDAAVMQEDHRRTVLVVGDSFCDVLAGPLASLPKWGVNVVSPSPILAQPGGAALNVACGLARLRGNTTLFSGIGRDAFGDLLRAHLSQVGVQLIEAGGDTSQPTGVCMVLSGPDDRAFCSHFGVSDTFDAASLLEDNARVLRALDVAHVHCAGFYSCGALRKTLPALLRTCKKLGATTSLDTNNDASGQWGAVDGLFSEILPLVDLFMPNHLEACAIAGVAGEDVDGAIAILAKQVGGQVVVTHGAQGAIIAGRGVEPRTVRSPTIVPVDPVGAGDAFKAGLLACFTSGVPLADAAQFGCLTGAMCVTTRGACTDPPSPARVAAFASSHGMAAAAAVLQSTVQEYDGGPSCHDRERLLGSGERFLLGGQVSEGLVLWWAFALLWLGGSWPYQALLQAQAFFHASALPNLDFYMLVCFTWPLLFFHGSMVLSGTAKASGYSRRVLAAFGINSIVGLLFLGSLYSAISPSALILTNAVLIAFSQILLEPALFGLASALKDGSETQAMMVGNAGSGVIVVATSVFSSLAGHSQQFTHSRAAALIFYALQVIYSLMSAGLYLYLLRVSPRLTAAVKAGSRLALASSSTLYSDANGAPVRTSNFGSRVKALRVAARSVWVPASCQALCFGVTLAAWPSIPGGACVAGGWVPREWWFTLVVGVYNLLDFLARLSLRRLRKVATRANPRALLNVCLMRLALIPVIYACVSPLMAGAFGNALILLAVAVLAASNGIIATASMMQVATLAPAGLGEEAVYVAVAGVYLGLAMGATFSWSMTFVPGLNPAWIRQQDGNYTCEWLA